MKKCNHFTSEAPVLLSFSGGPDSVYLLQYLKAQNNPVTLIYFDHQLRSESERAEEKKLILHYAEAEKYYLIFKKIPVTAYAKRYKCSIETAGRELRRKYWEHYASLYNIQYIATAHHLDDRCETFFHRVIRGTRTHLGSMSFQEPLTETITLIRPLLDISKKEILAFLEEKKLPYSQDSTNESLEFTRNKLRHTLLPIVEQLNPAYRKSIASLCDHLEELETYLSDTQPELPPIYTTETGPYIEKKALLALHPFLQKKLIFELLKKSTLPHSDKQIEHKHVVAVLEQLQKKRSSVSLPNGVQCEISFLKVRIKNTKLTIMDIAAIFFQLITILNVVN